MSEGARFTYTWSPAETALRAKLAGLSRAATSLGADMAAGAAKRYEAQARDNFARAYAKRQRKNPNFCLTSEEQEREIERMRVALVRMQMTEIAHRPRSSRAKAKNSRPILADEPTGESPTPRDPGL